MFIFVWEGKMYYLFFRKNGSFIFFCVDLVSLSKYREIVDMYLEFGLNINEEFGLESNEGVFLFVFKWS